MRGVLLIPGARDSWRGPIFGDLGSFLDGAEQIPVALMITLPLRVDQALIEVRGICIGGDQTILSAYGPETELPLERSINPDAVLD